MAVQKRKQVPIALRSNQLVVRSRRQFTGRSGDMITGRTPEELWAIARAGGGLVIDADRYTPDQLRGIAHAAADGKAPLLILENSDKKNPDDLRNIAEAGRGKVMFK